MAMWATSGDSSFTPEIAANGLKGGSDGNQPIHRKGAGMYLSPKRELATWAPSASASTTTKPMLPSL